MNKSKLVQQTISARKNVRNMAITMLPGDRCSIVNMSNYTEPCMPKSKAESLLHDFTQIKHDWSVLLCVFGRCPVSGEYWKTFDVAPEGKCYSAQINESLNEYHRKLLKGFNMNHFVSLGWIATPTNKLFDNNAVYDMFHLLGAFEYVAKWEL